MTDEEKEKLEKEKEEREKAEKEREEKEREEREEKERLEKEREEKEREEKEAREKELREARERAEQAIKEREQKEREEKEKNMTEEERELARLKPFMANLPVTTEENVLLAGKLETFDDTLSLEESEKLASFLTVPFLRIPLVLNFFAENRLGLLLKKDLKVCLNTLFIFFSEF